MQFLSVGKSDKNRLSGLKIDFISRRIPKVTTPRNQQPSESNGPSQSSDSLTLERNGKQGNKFQRFIKYSACQRKAKDFVFHVHRGM